MHKIPVGVLGASGYAGRELCALVQRHPGLELAFATANSQRGETALLPGGGSVTFRATEDVKLEDAALVLSSLPHGTSAEWVARARAASRKVVDLSTDLRIGNGASDGIPYGLTEVRREKVRGASVVANPGCYPTAILLGLLPLLEGDLVAAGATITVNAASGVTGAGLTPRLDLLFGEVAENFRAYGVGNAHRHLNEMRAFTKELHTDADLLFTPHLLPTARGILATITVPLRAPLAAPLELWRRRFAGERFVEVTDELPELRDVRHRNVARITVRQVESVRVPTIQVFSAIDNLVKGAAGQAIQNANLMLGLAETMGLPRMTTDRRRGDPPHLVRRRAAEAPHMATHVPVGTVVRVIKIGGRAQGAATLAPRLASAAAIPGARVVVVHGGGDEVSTLLRQMGQEPTFVGGRRVTRAEDLDAVRMVLSGRVNKRLVAQFAAAGVRVVGVSGEDGDLLTARITDPTMGKVGGDVFADASLVADLLNAGWLPVVSPLARDRDAVDGSGLNVNGDDAAAALASGLGADELLFIADVQGVMEDGVVLTGIDTHAIPALVERGVVMGGMLAKLEAAVIALRAGVRRVRIASLDGITDQSVGTTIGLAPSPSTRESA